MVRVQGKRDGMLIGLALQIYHQKQGHWPSSLNELTPSYLPELPLDRITGRPLKYLIVDDRPIVYSVGVDLDDDRGEVPYDAEADNALPHKAWPTKGDVSQPETDRQYDGDWVLWSLKKDTPTSN